MKKHTYGPRCVSWAFFLVIGHCIRGLHLPVVVVPRCLPPLPPPVLSFVVPLRVGAVRHRRCARAVVGCIHSHPLLEKRNQDSDKDPTKSLTEDC
jgi:hypothetical protein